MSPQGCLGTGEKVGGRGQQRQVGWVSQGGERWLGTSGPASGRAGAGWGQAPQL